MLPWKRPKANEDIEKRVGELEDELKSLRLDWDDVYARCRKLLGRTAKERERIEASQTREGAENGQVLEDTLGSTVTGRVLTPRQMAIQQAILRRRGGMQ